MTHFALDIPKRVAHNAEKVAQHTRRSLEEWPDQIATELPIEQLSNEQVLALCNSEMELSQQHELSDLLADNREGMLSQAGKIRLDELMAVYRHGLVRKAQAWKIVVERGVLVLGTETSSDKSTRKI